MMKINPDISFFGRLNYIREKGHMIPFVFSQQYVISPPNLIMNPLGMYRDGLRRGVSMTSSISVDKHNYNLLIDNLMDLTHIPFIHRKTIGGGDQSGQVNATMDVTPTETGVHYIRWMENIVPPPTYKLGAGWDDEVMCDRWQEFEFVAPATVIQWTGALEVGRDARASRKDKSGGFNIRIYHGATPETEDSVHYFWSPANGYKPEDEEATEILHEQIAATFLEDLEFLEAQHSALVANPNDLVNIKHDAARMPARRAVDKMIQAETAGSVAAE